MHMKVQNNSDVSFQRLYAGSKASNSPEFKAVKNEILSLSQKNDVFVSLIEEANEQGVNVQKFFVKVKDLASNFVGKTKTKKLDSNQLISAVKGARRIMERNEMKATYNVDEQMLKDVDNFFENFLNLFGGRKK